MNQTSSSFNHIPRIDILRAAAILCVFSSHFYPAVFGQVCWVWNGMWYQWTDHPDFLIKFLRFTIFDGYHGVELFFVISGLCIRLSHRAQSTFSTSHFYWRRFWRIYPPYLISLFIFAMIQHSALNNVIAHILMAHNFSKDFLYSINGPFWSLALEFQVYLLYPVLLLLHHKFGRRVTFSILFLLSMLSSACAGETPRHFLHLPEFFSLASHFPTVLWVTWYSGFLIADRLVDRESITLSRRCLLLAAICLIPLVSFYRPLTPLVQPVNAIIISFMVEEFLRCNLPPNRVGKWVGLIGVSSYSFYLYFDKFIIPLLDVIKRSFQFPRMVTFIIAFPLIFLFTTIFSYFAYRFIELPSIAVGRSLYGRFRRRKVVPNASA